MSSNKLQTTGHITFDVLFNVLKPGLHGEIIIGCDSIVGKILPILPINSDCTVSTLICLFKNSNAQKFDSYNIQTNPRDWRLYIKTVKWDLYGRERFQRKQVNPDFLVLEIPDYIMTNRFRNLLLLDTTGRLHEDSTLDLGYATLHDMECSVDSATMEDLISCAGNINTESVQVTTGKYVRDEANRMWKWEEN